MAPTTVTVESVTAPMAASRQATVRKITKVKDSVASSRVREINSSQSERVGGVAVGLQFGSVRPGGQHGVEDLEGDRAAMLDVECLEFLDDVVGAFPGDVGGDLVARGFEGRARVEQQVRDPDLAPQYAEHVVAQVLGGDHP